MPLRHFLVSLRRGRDAEPRPGRGGNLKKYGAMGFPAGALTKRRKKETGDHATRGSRLNRAGVGA